MSRFSVFTVDMSEYKINFCISENWINYGKTLLSIDWISGENFCVNTIWSGFSWESRSRFLTQRVRECPTSTALPPPWEAISIDRRDFLIVRDTLSLCSLAIYHVNIASSLPTCQETSSTKLQAWYLMPWKSLPYSIMASRMINLWRNKFGSRKGTEGREALVLPKLLLEKRWGINKPAYIAFIDIEKAFNNIRLKIFELLKKIRN